MLERFKFALYKRLVDHHFRGQICELTSLPRLYLLTHRFEVVLRAVNSNRDALDERKRFRVFSEHWRKHA